MSVLTGVVFDDLLRDVGGMDFNDEAFRSWMREECPPSPRVCALLREGKAAEAEAEYRDEVMAALLGVSVKEYRRTFNRPPTRAKRDSRQSSGTQVLYFVAYSPEPADGEPVKIGIARDVTNRLAQMQTHSPQQVFLLGTIEDAGDLEPALHRMFSDDRIRGEWFRMSPKLRAFISKKARK